MNIKHTIQHMIDGEIVKSYEYFTNRSRDELNLMAELLAAGGREQWLIRIDSGWKVGDFSKHQRVDVLEVLVDLEW